MNIFNCIVIDDDEIDRLMITCQIKKFGQLNLAGSYESAEEACIHTDFDRTDVLFLDIDMDGMDGITFRKITSEVPACIFITSHPEYALDSFSVDTLDFIVKPVCNERFAQAIERLEQFMELREKAHLFENYIGAESIRIREGNKEIRIEMHNILYLEGLKDYTQLVTKDKKHCVLTSIGNLLKEKYFRQFLRIHRSYAVRKDLVKSVGYKDILLHNGIELPVGRSFKDQIKTELSL